MPAAAGAELVDCPLLCYVLTSLSVSIGEGQTPPEMPLGAPPSGLTGAAAGAAFCGAGLLGAFLSKNVLTLLSSSASTASMIICLHSSLCRTPDSAPPDTNEHALQPSVVRLEHVKVTFGWFLKKIWSRQCQRRCCFIREIVRHVSVPWLKLPRQASQLKPSVLHPVFSGNRFGLLPTMSLFLASRTNTHSPNTRL